MNELTENKLKYLHACVWKTLVCRMKLTLFQVAYCMASRFSFYSFPGYEVLISTITFFSYQQFIYNVVDICNCIFTIEMSQLLISRIYFLLFLISIIKLSLVEMSILAINNSIATGKNDNFWYLKIYFWYLKWLSY